jgi:hypothetical protein
MFKEEFNQTDINEDVPHEEDAKKLKEFKKLLDKAYQYGIRNLKSQWAENTVIYALDEVRDYANKLKGK